MAQRSLENPKGIEGSSKKLPDIFWNDKLFRDKFIFYLRFIPVLIFLSSFISYINFIQFGGSAQYIINEDSARYVVSTLIQSEAAILAIIITLSLVAVQETASSYSPRVTEIFRNRNPDFWILILIYLCSIIYGSFVLIQIGNPILHPRDFGKHVVVTNLFNTFFDIQNAILFALLFGVFAFLFLIPYMLTTLDLLRPSKVMDILAENITDTKITNAFELSKKTYYDDFDPLHPIIDIMRSSLLCCDYQTAIRGLNSIHNLTDTILKSKKIAEKSYKEISLSLIDQFANIGRIAAKEKYEDFVFKVIIILTNIAHEAIIRKLEFVSMKAIEALCLIGKTTSEQKMESSTKKTLESLKGLGDEIVGIKRETSATVWDKKDTRFLISGIEISFIEIRKIAIEQQMTIIGKEAEVYEKELLEEITTSLTGNDLRDFLWWVLKANMYLKSEDNYNSDDALKYINKALKMDPLDFDALILKGDILLELEKEIEAVKAYDMASIVKPDDIIPIVLKGNTLYKIGKYNDALAAYDEALEIKQDDVFTWYNKASVLFKLEEYKSALDTCNKTLNIKPDYKYALTLQETIYREIAVIMWTEIRDLFAKVIDRRDSI